MKCNAPRFSKTEQRCYLVETAAAEAEAITATLAAAKARGWNPQVHRQFFLDCNEIADLYESAERIFASEPSVLQLKAPIKIFGDLHGKFGDHMRLFDEYGSYASLLTMSNISNV